LALDIEFTSGPVSGLMSVPVFVLLSFVVGAAIESWRKGGTDSRFKALVVGLGVAGPVLGAWTMWQFGLLRWGDFPTLYTPLFSITLVVMTFELSRTAAISRRSQLQVAALEAELTWAGRVSALGQLASGLAHELCQPLSAILNNTEAAQLQLGGDKPDVEELRSILRDIRESDTRAVQIIHRMRALIKRHKPEVRALTLGDVIQEVILLARSEARAKCVSLECCIESSLPPVLGDRVQISQVLLNLIMNGIQATQSNAARPRTISIEARIDGEHVAIAVRDSGPGVPAERMKRVFEPFYSTKPEGMGMGLAICRTIIEAHNGRIWVEQSQGGGATFLFTIPQAPEPAISPDGWRPPVSATGAERHATI